MTYQGLRSCSIGKAVNRLTKISQTESLKGVAEVRLCGIVARWSQEPAAAPAGARSRCSRWLLWRQGRNDHFPDERLQDNHLT